MARPNVSFTINDNSLVNSSLAEIGSTFVTGYLDLDVPEPNVGNMLSDLGTTAEREQGYMIIESLEDWKDRIYTDDPVSSEIHFDAFENEDPSFLYRNPFLHLREEDGLFVAGNSYANTGISRWTSGPKDLLWQYDWFFIENYLRYGGRMVIFSVKDTEDDTIGCLTRAKSKKINIDAFVSPFFTRNDNVREVVDARQDCIAITSVPSEYLDPSLLEFVTGQSQGGGSWGGYNIPSGNLFDSVDWGNSNITWQFNNTDVGTNRYYDQNTRVPGALRRPADQIYLKNKGSYSFPENKLVFSCFVFDKRPKQDYFGSTQDVKNYCNYMEHGKNEESYGVRGLQLPVNDNRVDYFYYEPVKDPPSFVDNPFSPDYNWQQTKMPTGMLYYNDNGLGTRFKVATNWRSIFSDDDVDRLYEGLTYLANPYLSVPCGRACVSKNLMDVKKLKMAYGQKKLNNGFEGGGTYPAGFNLPDILMPANWDTPFSWGLNMAWPGSLYQWGYDVLKGTEPDAQGGDTITGTSDIPRDTNPTTAIARIANNIESVSSLFDVRKTFDDQFNPVDYMMGLTAPWIGDGRNLGWGTWHWNCIRQYNNFYKPDYDWVRSKYNIYASDPSNLNETAEQYWGCTCADLPSYVNEIYGITPDICLEYGPNSRSQDVTADGSTYTAYIGWSSPIADVTVTGMFNVFGEFIGPCSDVQLVNQDRFYSGIFSDFVDKLALSQQVPYLPHNFTLPDGSTEPIGVKSILFYPLVEDPTEAYSLTADKENYFYAASVSPHKAGTITDIDLGRDPVILSIFRKFGYRFPENFGNPFWTGGYGIPSGTYFESDYSMHWYNSYNIAGAHIGRYGFFEESIGTIGNPGATAVYNFFGITSGASANKQHNGISNEGLHFIAEIDVVPGIPTGFGFVPPDITDPTQVQYENIFATNSGEYEFAVFGDKKIKSSFASYSSQEASIDPDNSFRVPFTSDVAGIFAKQFRDLAPWYSPANRNVSEIRSEDITLVKYEPSESEQDSLYESKINYIEREGNVLRLAGDKTFADSTSTFSRVNVTNLFIYLKKVLGPICRSVLFEQNDQQTRDRVINAITPILETIRSQRGITEFNITCDETNNTPDLVDSNQFVVDIFIKPTKTINFIKLRFTNTGAYFNFDS